MKERRHKRKQGPCKDRNIQDTTKKAMKKHVLDVICRLKGVSRLKPPCFQSSFRKTLMDQEENCGDLTELGQESKSGALPSSGAEIRVEQEHATFEAGFNLDVRRTLSPSMRSWPTSRERERLAWTEMNC
eukprot:6468730-Amphidinium_carterae.1